MSDFIRVPGNVSVRLDDGQLELKRWGRKRHSQPILWTRGPFAVDSDPTLHVLAARPLEWLIDLVVCRVAGDQHALDVWRVSPFRLLRQWRVGMINPGEGIKDDGTAAVIERGFRFLGRNHTFLIRQASFRADYRMYAPERCGFDVFISFKDKDAREWARALRRELGERDLRVWFSPEQVETDYDAAISEGVQQSASFAIIWSPNSNESPKPGEGAAVWSHSKELDLILTKESKPKFNCVVAGGDVLSTFVKDRYQRVDLERVGVARFADMILESFRRRGE